jgi:hypothetical protein
VARKPGLTFIEQAYSLRLDRFDHPSLRGLIAQSSADHGCVFIELRGDGAVSALELTIDGREPREPTLLRAQNPGTVALACHGARAWAIVDDVLHTLNLATMSWDGQLTIPKGVAKARLVAAGVDSVLLGPATTQVRGIRRALRTADGNIDLSDAIDTDLPTVVVPGLHDLWCYGGTGRVERREGLALPTESRSVPRFVDPLVSGDRLFALAVDKDLLRTTDITRLDAEPLTVARKVCGICGVDGQDRLVVMTETGTSSRIPPGDNPSRIELLATDSLRSLARHSIGTANEGRAFALCGTGTLAIVGEKALRLVTWDGHAQAPQMTRAVIRS